MSSYVLFCPTKKMSVFMTLKRKAANLKIGEAATSELVVFWHEN